MKSRGSFFLGSWVPSLLFFLPLLDGCEHEESEDVAAPSATPGIAIDPATTGTLRGVVTLTGTPPPPREMPLGGDPACARAHAGAVFDDAVLVHDGKLQNSFVYIKEGLEKYAFPAPEGNPTLDQQGCVYAPHIVGVQVKQLLQFINSDALMHNVHTVPQRNQSTNFGMAPGSQPISKKFNKPEVMVRIKCDVHPWMRAFVGVVAHPKFAITGADGGFTFDGLPPGDYVIAAWHEVFGAQEQKVTLGAKEQKVVSVGFAVP